MHSILDSGLHALSLGEDGALCGHQVCACGVAKWGDGSHLQEGRPEVVFKQQRDHTSHLSWEGLCLGTIEESATVT